MANVIDTRMAAFFPTEVYVPAEDKTGEGEASGTSR